MFWVWTTGRQSTSAISGWFKEILHSEIFYLLWLLWGTLDVDLLASPFSWKMHCFGQGCRISGQIHWMPGNALISEFYLCVSTTEALILASSQDWDWRVILVALVADAPGVYLFIIQVFCPMGPSSTLLYGHWLWWPGSWEPGVGQGLFWWFWPCS